MRSPTEPRPVMLPLSMALSISGAARTAARARPLTGGHLRQQAGQQLIRAPRPGALALRRRRRFALRRGAQRAERGCEHPSRNPVRHGACAGW